MRTTLEAESIHGCSKASRHGNLDRPRIMWLGQRSFFGLLPALPIIPGLTNGTAIGTSDVKHMDYAIFDGKDHSIAAYEHLMNLLRELIVFRCKRKRFRHDSELLQNGGPQVANPLLGFSFPPPAATPIV